MGRLLLLFQHYMHCSKRNDWIQMLNQLTLIVALSIILPVVLILRIFLIVSNYKNDDLN